MYRTMNKPLDISKELENINFEHILREEISLKTNKENNKITENVKIDVETKTQLAVFQSSATLLFVIGKCTGLSPMAEAWDTNSETRLGAIIRKFLFGIVIGVLQVILLIFSLISFKLFVSINSLGSCIFYLSTGINTFLYIYVGCAKLPGLLRELSRLPVQDYFDPSLKVKSFAICIVILTMAIIEHMLFYIAKLKKIGDITFEKFNYDIFIQKTYSWFYDLGYGGGRPVAIIIQIINMISTLNWNYSDMYIMCISIYLVSLMKHVNKKIVLASEKHYLPPSYWRALREEYTRVTRLVHSFNDVISGIILVSFANTLFFLCLQIYYILLGLRNQRDDIYVNGAKSDNNTTSKECSLYLGFSAAYLLARSIAVSLLAASVHSASLITATALYNVPSSSFCGEVARLLNQAHTDTVAISGLQFFNVTRELVLSLFGTIITYELVLLQFGGGDHAKVITC